MWDVDRQHVVPSWERHITDGADCWCEPRLAYDGQVVVHDARTCEDGGQHDFAGGTLSECWKCGQPRPKSMEAT